MNDMNVNCMAFEHKKAVKLFTVVKRLCGMDQINSVCIYIYKL